MRKFANKFNSEMNYTETIQYLFDSVPMFQQIGQNAYKAGLDTTIAIDNYQKNPHKKYHTIHIAGTNGKGSCSHTIAAILQDAGYKVGLYTSPHLIDFRERIKVNGEMASEEFVTEFVENNRHFFEPLKPSFFELTTAMAFAYFEKCGVDVAVIETGMGGRLDCTNIISPDMCIITNISFDHVQFLGNTKKAIAGEKAGIIKPGIPVVIGENDPETRPVFEAKAHEENAPVTFAEDTPMFSSWTFAEEGGIDYDTAEYGKLHGALGGIYQIKNTNTILHAIQILKDKGYNITADNVRNGFADVQQSTGLCGRWQTISKSPLTICDAGHNTGGISYIAEQLKMTKYDKLFFVIGMVNDKDVSGVMALLPKDARYIFTKATVKRALDEHELQRLAGQYGLEGECMPDVASAYRKARELAGEKDCIFVGGSCFIVADFLSSLQKESE